MRRPVCRPVMPGMRTSQGTKSGACNRASTSDFSKHRPRPAPTSRRIAGCPQGYSTDTRSLWLHAWAGGTIGIIWWLAGRGNPRGVGSNGRRPLADRLLVPPEGYLRPPLRPDRIGLALGALRMDACRRIDGVLADRASSPPGIEQRRMVVVVPGLHHCVPAGEQAGGSLDQSDRTGWGSRRNEAFNGIAEEGSKARASLSPPTNPEEGFS